MQWDLARKEDGDKRVKILVIGGTRFFGIPMIQELVRHGHDVTIATRGCTPDDFGNTIKRIIVKDIYNEQYAKEALEGLHFDVVIDKMCYGSLDISNILDNVKCSRFIHMSTAGVYQLDHMGIREDEFRADQGEIVWCHRGDIPYDDAKKSAERVLCQRYKSLKTISVRYPFVIGENDYTNRLRFYVAHVLEEKPMYVDNMEEQICFIDSQTAGTLIAKLAELDEDSLEQLITGYGSSDSNSLAINGCLDGTISISEILRYIEHRTEKKAIVLFREEAGADEGTYNKTIGNSLDTTVSRKVIGGYQNVKDVIYRIIDIYIEQLGGNCQI